MNTRVPWLAAMLTLSAVGCGKHPGSYDATASVRGEQTGAQAAVAEAEALWEQRDDAEKLAKALELYQRALDVDPANRTALERLTRGWYLYGDSHTDDKDAKIERWGNAIAWGTRCLSLNEAFAQSIRDGGKEKDAAAFATREDVPCLYWTASAIGKWGKIQGLPKTLKHLPTVKAYITRIGELDPEYYYFGPARYWGAYYAVLPSFAGQDLGKSSEYFAASIAGAPSYLATRVLRAELLAVKTEDVATFVHDLQFVIDFDVSSDPATRPENVLEQGKARALLAKRNELFDAKVIETFEAQQ